MSILEPIIAQKEIELQALLEIKEKVDHRVIECEDKAKKAELICYQQELAREIRYLKGEINSMRVQRQQVISP